MHTLSMDIELRNDRIPRNPFDRQFLDMIGKVGGGGGGGGSGPHPQSDTHFHKSRFETARFQPLSKWYRNGSNRR